MIKRDKTLGYLGVPEKEKGSLRWRKLRRYEVEGVIAQLKGRVKKVYKTAFTNARE